MEGFLMRAWDLILLCSCSARLIFAAAVLLLLLLLCYADVIPPHCD